MQIPLILSSGYESRTSELFNICSCFPFFFKPYSAWRGRPVENLWLYVPWVCSFNFSPIYSCIFMKKQTIVFSPKFVIPIQTPNLIHGSFINTWQREFRFTCHKLFCSILLFLWSALFYPHFRTQREMRSTQGCLPFTVEMLELPY